MAPLLNYACLLEEMVGEQGQSDPRGRLSKPKYVKLPVVLSILKISHPSQEVLLSRSLAECCNASKTGLFVWTKLWKRA